MNRRGFSMIEVLAATAVVAAMVSLATEAIVAQARHERELARRAAVLENASSALEEITAQNYDDITPEVSEKLKLADRFQGLLSPAIAVDVMEENDPAPGKRVTLHVHWGPKDARFNELQLTTYVYRDARVKR